MFLLELYDRIGNKLKIGDIVKVSNGQDFSFFAEVKYLEEEQVITPFHTFSFHSFEKVEKVPDNAKLLDEKRYKIWYVYPPEKDDEKAKKDAEKYLSSWRNCEHHLEKRCYRIKKVNEEQLKLF
jgi:hypothetical protein